MKSKILTLALCLFSVNTASAKLGTKCADISSPQLKDLCEANEFKNFCSNLPSDATDEMKRICTEGQNPSFSSWVWGLRYRILEIAGIFTAGMIAENYFYFKRNPQNQNTTFRPNHTIKPSTFRPNHTIKPSTFEPEPAFIPNFGAGVKKPVIYLYSDVETSVSVSIEPRMKLTFTYPQYVNSWDITTKPGGSLYSQKDQKEYPYLFWEGEFTQKQIEKIDLKKGFCVESGELISFLEKKLSQLGLSSKEMTDFITFWAPEMVRNKYNIINFLVDENYEKWIAGIKLSQKPDSMRRIYMFYKGSSEKVNIQPQDFSSLKLERKGLTLIEWGGSILN